jgi:protein tyrosine/serine phosphatase
MIRRLPFAGALNFRDIGGYPSGHGGLTRWGAVYRSDSLHYLTEDDLPAFDALDVKTIYDLRRASERSGKDRTGMAAALLLTALGVDRETVLDDYELTNDYRSVAQVPDVIDKFVDAGIRRDAAAGMLSAPRWAMAKALDELDMSYAGIDEYLLGPGGMSDGALQALRAALLR